MLAREIMSHPVLTAPEDATLRDVANLMRDRRIGGVPIVGRDERIVGIITVSDFAAKQHGIPFSLVHAPKVLGEWLGREGLEAIYERAGSKLARDIMTTPVVCGNEGDTLERIVELMLEHDVTRIPVVRDEVPVGIVARHDLLSLLSLRLAGRTEPTARP
ncbi:MAG TPA: CBS domain-containing protein [Candidatus Thermoplasmatota archaeon]|nr:CBS domain-containing protein [Candidatus Thermoplasmatota archaeon]